MTWLQMLGFKQDMNYFPGESLVYEPPLKPQSPPLLSFGLESTSAKSFIGVDQNRRWLLYITGSLEPCASFLDAKG